MGSRGSFLESGGFSAPSRWHTVDYVDGIKVLAPKNPKSSINLPERSNTPGTAYISYDKKGIFKALILFRENRFPEYRIDFGVHQSRKSLHVHFFNEYGEQIRFEYLKKDDFLYKKYKNILKDLII